MGLKCFCLVLYFLKCFHNGFIVFSFGFIFFLNVFIMVLNCCVMIYKPIMNNLSGFYHFWGL
jgi:hypothetical protein